MPARSTYPFHFILLPVFFVLHGFNENSPFVPPGVAGILLLTYLTAGIIIFGLSLLILRSYNKAAVITFIILSINFFFGSFHDWLKSSFFLNKIAHYSILLPCILIIIPLFYVLLKRTKNQLQKLTVYLNVLMILFLTFETIYLVKNSFRKSGASKTEQLQKKEQAARAPDIYFILLDSYAGSSSLKEIGNYDNSAIENELRSEGFYVPRNSYSNYNFTPFSLASTLNMKYLSGIKDMYECDAEDYALRAEEIKENAVAEHLSGKGYDIVNYSVFDLKGHPTLVNETFLPLKGRLITDQTLLNRIKKDLLPSFYNGKYAIKWLHQDIYTSLYNNTKLIKLTEQASLQKSPQPRFIYTHLYMPHPPYYYDANGRLRSSPRELEQEFNTAPLGSYLNNIKPTNKVVRELVNTIMSNSDRKAIIILTGDHGFRPRSKIKDNRIYNTFSAFYIPGRKYDLYYDSISNVNQFRVLFNTVFGEHFNLLKDSTFYLRDKIIQ